LSIVAESTIGSIIAMLLQKGGKFIETLRNKNGDLEIKSLDENKELRETVTIPSSRKADAFSFAKIKRATSAATEKPSTPDIEIANPRKIDSTIHSISLLPNAQFKTDGIFLITVNKVVVFESLEAANLTDATEALQNLLRGKKIRASEKVRVFIWNGLSATNVSLAVMVNFGE